MAERRTVGLVLAGAVRRGAYNVVAYSESRLEIVAPCTANPWDPGGSERRDVGGNYTTLSDGTPVRMVDAALVALSARDRPLLRRGIASIRCRSAW
jgi:hypothetical protein